jgi:hypothetical protein
MSRLSDNAPFALRIATIAWAALTMIHFTIWAMVCIIGGHLASPWWLWIGLPPGVVIGALWWLARRRPADEA